MAAAGLNRALLVHWSINGSLRLRMRAVAAAGLCAYAPAAPITRSDAVRIVYMSKLLSPPAAPGLLRKLNPNRIFLPRALRDAIPSLPTCIGRDLVLEGLSGRVVENVFMGRCVQLELLAVETGKLTGQFPLRISLSVEATRALAENLTKLADQAGTPAGYA